MKQYLTEAQSLELRSKKYPNRTHFIPQVPYDTKVPVFTYSIGDLLEFLPNTYYQARLRIDHTCNGYRCLYIGVTQEYFEKELIDALFKLLNAVRPNGYFK